MSMEATAWHSMYTAMHAQRDRRPFSRATVTRIARFARPHRRRLVAFVLVSVVTAAGTVATPLLAGRVVDAIETGAATRVVVSLAVIIAVVALRSEERRVGKECSVGGGAWA